MIRGLKSRRDQAVSSFHSSCTDAEVCERHAQLAGSFISSAGSYSSTIPHFLNDCLIP
jgi:hypothetical protein